MRSDATASDLMAPPFDVKWAMYTDPREASVATATMSPSEETFAAPPSPLAPTTLYVPANSSTRPILGYPTTHDDTPPEGAHEPTGQSTHALALVAPGDGL